MAVWFSLFVAIYSYCRYFLSYNYFFVEQFSFFRFSREYAENTLSQPGGLSKYLADFLTQFYFYPEIGPLITATIGVLLTILLDLSWQKISHHRYYIPILSALPALTLIWIETDFNYYLSGTVSLLLAVGAFYMYMRLAQSLSFYIRFVLLVALSWPVNFLLGPNSLLMVALCAVYELNRKEKRSLLSLLALPLTCIFPVVLYHAEVGGELYSQLLPEGYYVDRLPAPLFCYLPWATVLLNIVLAKLCSRNALADKATESFMSRCLHSIFVIALQFIAIIGFMHWGVNHYNLSKNYEAKAFDYYSRVGNWEALLKSEHLRASENFMHTCYQNLALSSLNMMGDKLFSFPQLGLSGLAIKWNKTVNSSVLLSDVYWQACDIALAQEMAFEGMIASRDGVNPRLLMRLVQTNLVSGNYPVAQKYINLLEDTYSYAAQANKYKVMLFNDEAVLADAELGPRRIGMHGTTGLTNTQSFADNLQQIMQHNPNMLPAFHYFGSMCLLVKDMVTFKEFVNRYHETPSLSDMPVHFQEAVVLIYENEKERWDELGVSSSVKERYDQYRKLFLENRGTPLLHQKMARTFGNTYWFYYMFKK